MGHEQRTAKVIMFYFVADETMEMKRQRNAR